jgi:DNA-damage-inducible protein D
VSEKIGQLKLQAPDGKMRNTDCANTETLFRIIQSIPSPKAENNKIIPICYKFKLKSVG